MLDSNISLHLEGWGEKIVFVREWIPEEEEILGFFKTVQINPSRLGAQIREDQVIDTLE